MLAAFSVILNAGDADDVTISVLIFTTSPSRFARNDVTVDKPAEGLPHLMEKVAPPADV